MPDGKCFQSPEGDDRVSGSARILSTHKNEDQRDNKSQFDLCQQREWRAAAPHGPEWRLEGGGQGTTGWEEGGGWKGDGGSGSRIGERWWSTKGMGDRGKEEKVRVRKHRCMTDEA
jgi:hypothetical protein